MELFRARKSRRLLLPAITITTSILLVLVIFLYSPRLKSKQLHKQETVAIVNPKVTYTEVVPLKLGYEPEELLPEVDWEKLDKDIKTIITKERRNYGVYIIDLVRGEEWGLNEAKKLPPASISKVPTAVLVLQEVDKGNITLNTRVTYSLNAVSYYYGPIYENYIPGEKLRIREYLEYAIVDSDNTATVTLENVLGGYLKNNEKTINQLGVEVFFRWPHEAYARDIAKVFEGIYKGTYLKDDTNNFLLNLLLNTAPHLQDGIPAGLPEQTKIAHKTGQLPGYSWEDAGIIYGEKTDYVLVIINREIDYDTARSKIQQISKVVYEALNK